MKNVGKIILGLFVCVAVSAGVSYLTLTKSAAISSETNDFGRNAHTVAIKAASGIQTDFTIAAEQSINAVVHIAVKSTRSANQPTDILEYFFGNQGQSRPQQRQPLVGYGSGVIISSDGYIVTNNHVVDGADELMVTLNERTDFPAKIVGVDPNTDLALLKIEATNLPMLNFGNSEDLKVGEWVLAVGNPMNLTSTVTAGIVSAKARNLGIIDSEKRQNNPFQRQNSNTKSSLSLESFIQTDAAVNPGNSGGALVNLKGELVGINSAIISPTGAYTGYSFAIPVNIVAKVVNDIKKFGAVQRAMLGVSISTINTNLANEKKIKVQDGVYVESVVEQSGAMQAGIKPGDIIKSLNEKKVNSSVELQTLVGMYHPSDVVKVLLLRDGKELTLNVKLLNTKGGTDVVKAAGLEQFGAAFREIKPEVKKSLNISGGVQVAGVSEGKFKEAGIRDGFIILKVNDLRINDVKQLEKIIESVQRNSTQDESVLFITGLYPNGKVTFYAVDATN